MHNATHTCHSYEDREMQIATKNNCNRFGCVLSSLDGGDKKGGQSNAHAGTTVSGSKHPTATESSVSQGDEHTSPSTEFRIN